MRRLPRPHFTGIAALNLCASSIRDQNLKNRLNLVKEVVDFAEQAYALHAEVATLYLIGGTDDVGGHLTGKQMERVYNDTFVKSAKTRTIYDQLKKACENDICPLCGQGTVYQLDHYLPITSFPVYGVSSVNLVPACADCNKRKRAYAAAAAGDQTLHPYFDDVEQERWLFASVNEVRPAALAFSVKPPSTWNDLKMKRVATHFRIFGLGALYATHAAVEINNMRFALTKMATEPDSAQRISAHLRERAESCAVAHRNSWQTATLEALADSDWFCTKGFRKD